METVKVKWYKWYGVAVHDNAASHRHPRIIHYLTGQSVNVMSHSSYSTGFAP